MRSKLLASMLVLAGTLPVLGDDDADRARQKALSGKIMPLVQILQNIGVQYPGEVLDVELDDDRDDDDDATYDIRIMQQNGRVLEIEVDARTGNVIDVDEDD
jgi:uncharacterized membrane protein YkoI